MFDKDKLFHGTNSSHQTRTYGAVNQSAQLSPVSVPQHLSHHTCAHPPSMHHCMLLPSRHDNHLTQVEAETNGRLAEWRRGIRPGAPLRRRKEGRKQTGGNGRTPKETLQPQRRVLQRFEELLSKCTTEREAVWGETGPQVIYVLPPAKKKREGICPKNTSLYVAHKRTVFVISYVVLSLSQFNPTARTSPFPK